ncbi:hypothetical protein OIE69_17905 [Actinacidiphila glaucinigra]|uniref:hypothetical protein n=1 Tax=Actinacidiphila glaucinigra TaxID=235986 RepID=UPI002DD8BAC6|nr:hypothetical protein [Actinacidiphila glaucinigra]WSD60668.1 hypothetical protein OIE69_17905 [Actinacidiphila glaucinigra]
MATAAAVAIGAVSLGASAMAAPAGPAAPAAHRVGTSPAAVAAKAVAAPRKQTPQVVTQLIGKGRVDGKRWSVALEFHRTLPEGYELPTSPDGTTAPGTALLCQRMYIDGVRIDHQGGPWSDCQPVTGTHDPAGSGGMGLWGFQDKGTSGSRLMVSNPEAAIAYGIVDLTDGTRLKAATVTVPGTDYRAWAVAIPDGKTISAVDQYDKRHHRLTHDTYWR